MGYTHELSNFPNAIINMPTFKDVDENVRTLVEQVRQYRMSGDYGAAANLIERNSALLRQYNFSAEDVNRIIEEIRNTQIYIQSKKQQIYYGSISASWDLADQDVWISPNNLGA